MAQDTRYPYPGLRSYESEESDLFFGREGCVDDMLAGLAETRFLAVLGTSGSGKSSLVRTGLLDALELGFLPGRTSEWHVADMHPGGRPMRNLARVLVTLDGAEADDIELSLMQSFVMRGPRSIIQWCDDRGLREDQSLLLIVDQFEELFRYRDYAGREEAEAFVALLLESARADPRIHVVITMRSEFLGACAMMPGLAEQINSGLYLTRRMTRGECEQAIEGPAHVIGFEVEPRLTSEILNDMASLAPWDRDDALTSLEQLSRRADQLPLMQHVLNRLYERAQQAGGSVVLKFADYQQIGRLRGAIDAHAAEILDSLGPEVGQVAEPVFRALVTGTNLSNAVREPRRFGELVEVAGGDAAAVRQLVDAFRAQGCSFLRPTPSVELEPETIVDLGHESLVRQWTQLGDWLVQEARDGATWNRILNAYEAKEQGEGDLLSGLDLANAQSWWVTAQPTAAWARRHGGKFAELKAFLDDSTQVDAAQKARIAEGERQRVRRLRTRAAIYLSLAIISVGAALFGWTARNEATVAREKAEAAFESAEIALGDAQAANALAISASETFLIDMTERLRKSFGVKPEDVDEMLAEGARYLDRLDAQMPDDPSLRRARAKLLLENAWVAYNRSDYAGSRAYLDDARVLLSADDQMSPEVALVLIEVDAIDSANLRSLGQIEQALDVAENAEVLLVASGPAMSEADRAFGTARVYVAMANALGELGRIDQARTASQHCLDKTEGSISDRRVLSERAICAGSRLWIENISEEAAPTAELIASLDDIVEALSKDRRDIRDWRNWTSFQSYVAYAYNNSGDVLRATDAYETAAKELDVLVTLAPYNDWISFDRAKAYANLNYAYWAQGDPERALDAGLTGIAEFETLGEKLRSNQSFAETYLKELGDTLSVIRGVSGWRQDVDNLQLAADITTKWNDHALYMYKTGLDMCAGCAFIPGKFVSEAFEGKLEAGEAQAAAEILRVFDEVRELLQSLEADDPEQTAVVQSRRSLFWIATDLPSNARDREAFENPAEAISVFEGSAERLEYMITTYPDAREMRFNAAQAYAELAQLYHEAGRPVDAQKAIQRGVELEGFEALSRLLSWAETGDGPLPQDTQLASQMSQQLAARDWSGRELDVLADELWTEGVENKVKKLFVRDVPIGAGSALDIAIAESETLKGYRVSEESIARLREWERQAEANNETFLRYVSREILGDGTDDPAGALEIEARLRLHAETNQIYEAAVVIARQYNNPSLRLDLTQALEVLLSNTSETGYVNLMNFMIEVGLMLGRNDAEAQAITVFDAIMENADVLSISRQAAVLRQRSQYYEKTGNPDAALRDDLLALAMFPNNHEMLNDVGYELAGQDNMLPMAISLLERAVAVEPADSGKRQFAMDSLGWAYVRAGEIERGLDLIKEAFIIGDDDQAEIMFHVGEAHRRLGANDHAVAAYLLAREYIGSTEVKAGIEQGLNRLGHFPDFTPQEIQLTTAIHAARLALEPGPEIAVDASGVAVRGFDTVALFSDGALIKGHPRHWSVYQDAIWLFATAKNKMLFDAAPDRFVPAHGGFCAYCLVSDNKVPGDPTYWTLTQGKLYLHSSANNAENWSEAAEALAVRAETGWSRLRQTPADRSSPSHIAGLLNAMAVGADIQTGDRHVTFASREGVQEARQALAALNGKAPPVHISIDRVGVAVGGYDTVAYHTAAQATRGSLTYWAVWNDALWLFESAGNRDLFVATPEQYAPAFGGYCAYCLAGGTKAHGDPRYWLVIDGQLTLATTEANRANWRDSGADRVAMARQNWTDLATEPAKGDGRPSRFVALIDALRRDAEVTTVEW